jgi:succinoglycan biosynthesis protein ExoU
MSGRHPSACVDVIIAAWNRAKTIERAMLSALAEPEVRRVIVVDDGSTDDTMLRAERVAAARRGRVVVKRLPQNGGPSAARNLALAQSNAPWVAILDGDDFFRRGRIAKLLSLAADNDFVADDLEEVVEGQCGQAGRDGAPRTSLLAGDPRNDLGPWRLDLETFVLGNVGTRRHLGFLKPIIRRSFLDRHRLRYDQRLRLGEDYALYARALALRARFLVVPQCGYVSVKRRDSLSARHGKQDLERLRDADLELARMTGLTARERRALERHYRSVDARAQWVAVIDAVKARSAPGFLRPFLRSPTVSTFLIARLVEQARLRGGRRLIDLAATARRSSRRASSGDHAET